MATNWHEKAEESMTELLRNSDSPVFHSLIEFLIAAYEAEKEKLVCGSDDLVHDSYIRTRVLRDLRDQLTDSFIVD